MCACCLCGQKNTEKISTRDRKGEALVTVICKNCGLVRHDPLPTNEEIALYYERNYRIDYKKTFRPKPKHVYRAGHVALDRIQQMTPWLDKTYDVLDVGSGGGELCYMINKLGYSAVGIEPNRGYASHARNELGLDIYTGPYETAPYQSKSFDLVTLFHVLEHLLHPVSVLSKIHQWIRPEGHLIVEVPNVEALCITPKNRFHFAHIYNFNIFTLEWAGKKCGFSIKSSYTSKDTGIIRTVFKKEQNSAPMPLTEINGNFQRIQKILNAHTTWKHYCTFYPYKRFLKKLQNRTHELSNTSKLHNSQDILNKLFLESNLSTR